MFTTSGRDDLRRRSERRSDRRGAPKAPGLGVGCPITSIRPPGELLRATFFRKTSSMSGVVRENFLYLGEGTERHRGRIGDGQRSPEKFTVTESDPGTVHDARPAPPVANNNTAQWAGRQTDHVTGG
jgi:hypothetical protein